MFVVFNGVVLEGGFGVGLLEQFDLSFIAVWLSSWNRV